MGRQLGGIEPELQRTPGGARLLQNGSVLSEVLSQPGPTDSVFDVLAAALNLSKGTHAGILGFAGGGVIAPLRAMGGRHTISGVDLDESGYKLFRDISDDRQGGGMLQPGVLPREPGEGAHRRDRTRRGGRRRRG